MAIEWKEIKDAPDYWISNRGEIISKRTKKEKEIKQVYNKKTGYKQATLLVTRKGEKPVWRKTFYPHQLVAKAFVENPNGYNRVNHKDLDKGNNHFWNLEWVSQEQNIHHYYNSDVKNKPRNMRAIEVWDIKGNFLGEFPSISKGAKEVGTSASTLHQILTGETKQSTKYIVKYISS